MKKSLRQQLEESGWDGYLANKRNLPEIVADVAIHYAKGEYSDFNVLPIHLAMEGEKLVPVDASLKLVYALPSKQLLEKRRTLGLLLSDSRQHSLECKNIKTGKVSEKCFCF